MPKTTKKQSKLAAVLTKLKPNTGKKKLLLFVVIFALVGGGYMAYRSFAATGAGVYTADQLEASANTFRLDGSNSNGEKRGMPVVVMKPGSNVKLAGNWQPVIWAPFVRACANVVMHDGYRSNVHVQLTIGGSTVSEAAYIISSSTTYKKICTNYASHTNANARVGVWVINPSQAAGAIRVGSVSIEYTNGGK